MFGDLPIFDVATRIPLILNLIQCWKDRWMFMFCGGSFHSSVASVHCGSITTQLRSRRFPELHLTALVCLLGYRENEVLLVFLSFHHFLGFTFETLIFMPWARKSAFAHGIYISPSCLGTAWCFHSLLHASLLEHRSHCFGVSWSWLLSLNKLQLFQGMDHIFLVFIFSVT